MSEQQSSPVRVALVTGTASGIGAAIMQAMCDAGHQVLAVDFSDEGAEVADKAGAAFFKADLLSTSELAESNALSDTVGFLNRVKSGGP